MDSRLRLRSILADLYPDEASTRRIIADAGFMAGQIAFSPRALDTWHSILTEANKTGKVDRLFEVVLSEYGSNQQLSEACQAYLAQPQGALLADAIPAPGEPPFKGLQFFDVNDADIFFGREQLTAKLVLHLTRDRFLAVVGASGSGKSSLVRAGLIPALQRGKSLVDGTLPPNGSERWQVQIITPTTHPLEVLATRLVPDSAPVKAITTLIDDLASDKRSLHFAIRRFLSQVNAESFLLVVDQFEELFTLCHDEAERRAFVDNLLFAVAPETDGPTRLVITLRADFYAHCAQFENLRDVLSKQQEYIGPMNTTELRRSIEEPAQRSGWEFEPGLVELLLRDVGDEPGALPLLSHALLETWQRRRGRMLTFQGYEEAGGVQGAIARTAETVFNQRLSSAQQIIARNIFVRLTGFSEVVEATRRRAALSELISGPDDAPAVESVLRTLADARLIITGQGTAEVAHEAIISEWPKLRAWLAEDRPALQIQRRLTDAANEWIHLGRDAGLLYRGIRLVEADQWAANYGIKMNAIEREFLNESRTVWRRERFRIYLFRALVGMSIFCVLGSGLWWLVYIPLERRWTEEQALKDNPLTQMPGGEITFGAGLDPQYLDYGERISETVSVQTFLIQKHEVTNAEYNLCVRANICEQPSIATDFVNPNLAHYPVANVTALQANVYCSWLDLRLPTEIEWERAARGLIPGRNWPWGDDDPSPVTAHLTFPGLMQKTSAPVESYPAGATPEGVVDLIGNVAEWTSTTIVEETCPTCPRGYRYLTDQWLYGQEDVMLVLRGGTWDAEMTRVTQISWQLAKSDVYSEYVGFRCAKSIIAAPEP